MFFDESFTIFGFRLPDFDFFVLPFIALGIMYIIVRHATTMMKNWYEIYSRGFDRLRRNEPGYLGDIITGALGVLACLVFIAFVVPAFFWGIAGMGR